MGRVVVVGTIFVVSMIAVLVWLAWDARRSDKQDDKRAGRPIKGDLNATQERELGELLFDAHRILTAIGVNNTVEQMTDPEIIRTSTRREIAAWTARYRNRKAQEL